jgi:Prokaryotic dksA/traR C4-type zinc finger
VLLMTADLVIFRPPAAIRRDPAGNARHLDPAALPQWRNLLGIRWQEQLELIARLSAEYRDERAAAARHQAALERLVLAEIWDALVRLRAGRFGWCERCGTAITAARLAARPQARYCPACEN